MFLVMKIENKIPLFYSGNREGKENFTEDPYLAVLYKTEVEATIKSKILANAKPVTMEYAQDLYELATGLQ